MKKLILLAALLLLPASPALAGVSCTLPFTLTNGTPADATQVMANYNALVSCLANAASAGINSDITALTGLTTPLSPLQGGTTQFAGGTSSGPVNAQVVAATTPNSFALSIGYCVNFIAGATNTAAATLQVGVTPATNVFRQSSAGPQALIGGELTSGLLSTACYDGTQYQLTNFGVAASLTAPDQLLSGGANVTPRNLGTMSSGGFAIDCGLGPLQSYVNAGAHTIGISGQDGSCQIMIFNSASAGGISTSGINFGQYSGDPYLTTNGLVYLFSYTRINGVAVGFFKRVN